MKTLAILALAIAGFTVAPASTQAADYGYSYRPAAHCAPTFVGTREVCRTTQCQYGYDHCGRRISYNVVVVTYANYYSGGSSRTFTRTFRA